MIALLDLLESNVGHCDPVALAKMVHKQYMSTIWLNGRLSGSPMPIWRTWSVLEHILFHECDPRYVSWLAIMDLRRAMASCATTAFVRDPSSGAMMPTKSLELHMKMQKQLMELYKVQPEKMILHAPTSQVNLAKANRRVSGVVVRKEPKHYAHTVVTEAQIT